MNLQLDHFPMIKTQTKTNPRPARWCTTNNTTKPRRSTRASLSCVLFEHGSHNVSRWMTWLPISLKNAAKCDKWYQLQNHSITESLNANGAREKPPTAIPVHAVSLSVEQKPNLSKESWLVKVYLLLRWQWAGGQVVTPNSTRHTVGSWVIHIHCIRVCGVASVMLASAINKRNYIISLVVTNTLLLQT